MDSPKLAERSGSCVSSWRSWPQPSSRRSGSRLRMPRSDINWWSATSGEGPRSSHEQRSLVPRPDVSMVSVDPGGRYDRPARNAGTLASGRLSSLLALEIELAGRSPANRNRIAGTDQADQHGEPLWGAPRIHGDLLKLGFSVAQSTVAKYMVKRRGPSSQGWRTFLRNHAPDIAAMDLFVVPTIGFKLLHGFVIVRKSFVHTQPSAGFTIITSG